MAMGMSTDVESEENDQQEALTKIVFARRTEYQLRGSLNSLSILQHLQVGIL